jgi:hypothetical protein
MREFRHGTGLVTWSSTKSAVVSGWDNNLTFAVMPPRIPRLGDDVDFFGCWLVRASCHKSYGDEDSFLRPLIRIMPVIKDQITTLRRHNA